MAAPNPQMQPPSDVTFSLSYATLISLIKSEISPVSAYLNGAVKISGSIEDAMALNHLAARAKELNLRLV
jgi:putative sterol carrier protein